MSFCLRPNFCKKCRKPLTLFEGWTCLECEKKKNEQTEERCCVCGGVKRFGICQDCGSDM